MDPIFLLEEIVIILLLEITVGFLVWCTLLACFAFFSHNAKKEPPKLTEEEQKRYDELIKKIDQEIDDEIRKDVEDWERHMENVRKQRNK